MATSRQKLFLAAKKAGYSSADLRNMETNEIEDLLSNGTRPVKKKSKTTGTVQKKRGRPVGSKNSTRTTPTKKRGRPKGTTNKPTTLRKRTTVVIPKSKRNGQKSTDGRHVLGAINYKKKGDWNPREGSAPDRIVKALARFNGDREKVFNHLKSDMKDFVGTRRGKKYKASEAEQMLRYRISRTAWQFALATNQHEVSTKRAEYGTAGTGEGIYKRTRKTTKATRQAPTKKRTTTAPKKKATGRSQTAPKPSSDNGVASWSDAKLKKYLKSYVGKRGRRPAEYQEAVKLASKRKIAV